MPQKKYDYGSLEVAQLLPDGRETPAALEGKKYDYGKLETLPPPDNSAILAQQAAKYPTSAEKGGKPGQAQVGLLETILNTEPQAQTGMGAEAGFMGAGIPGQTFAKVPSAMETVAAPAAKLATGLGEQIAASPLVGAAKDLLFGPSLLSRVKALRGPVAAPEETAAVTTVRKLAPSTNEAQATAGRIADEAVKRGSIRGSKQPVIDHYTFQDLASAEAELKAAKQSLPPGQKLPGQPVVERLDQAVKSNQMQTPPHIRYGSTTTSISGGEYDPVVGIDQETLSNARAAKIGQVRDDVAKLIDDSGQIDVPKLQDLKEYYDRQIYEHSGWKDSGSAADRANLYGLREANGQLRDVLESIGNKRLNEANATYSHFADQAKIVELRRPDLQGLDSSSKKAARALTPLRKPEPGPAIKAVKRGAGMVGKAAATGLGIGGAYEIGQRLRE